MHSDVLYRRSTNVEATFGNVINLSNNSGDSGVPDIDVSGNDDVYIVWADNNPGSFLPILPPPF